MKNSLYTEEIMKHFKDPQNIGKIENPDGIGKVGNVVCLPPGSKVQANPSLYSIETLKVGSQVLSHNGKYGNISNIFKRNYSGKIVVIRNRLGTVRLTPEHMVMSIKVPKMDKYLRINNKRSLPSGWYHADELDVNDILLYPRPKKTIDVKRTEINVPKYKYDFKSKKIPESIAVDGNFLRLAGYFISEGDTCTNMCRVRLTLTFGSREKEYIDDASALFKKIFGVVPTVRINERKNVAVIMVNNVHITRFFRRLFGKGCINKQIPEFMLFLPLEKQKELIRGLWRGDGFINPKIPRAGFSTVSNKLVQQVKFLLIRQGIIPSVYTEKERTTRGVKHREAYRIHVGSWSVRELAKILGVSLCEKELTNDSWVDENYIYLPITHKDNEFFEGAVYNLEVENTHSFTTDSVLLHNCGDVMWFYIKVEDNRIADVKFQTFGCVVAIAVSSILTTMVKGKTLEEAMDTTKFDILKNAGKVPPIKIHCSVLAADALHEAIYDYLTKNKMKIPEKLEKEHQRIKKDLDKVETEHSELVEVEESLNE